MASSREYPERPLVGVGGVVIDNGRLFLRSVNRRATGPHEVTFVSSMPLTAATVEQLAQGLGTIYIIPDVGKVLKEVDAQDKSVGPHITTARELAERTEESVGGGTLAAPAFLLGFERGRTRPEGLPRET